MARRALNQPALKTTILSLVRSGRTIAAACSAAATPDRESGV